MIKSPLRYPGGKSQAVQIITSRFPFYADVIVSPFMGGGSIELWAAQNGIKVYGYDGFSPLVYFWQCLFDSDDIWDLINIVQLLHPMSKDEFKYHQKLLIASGYSVFYDAARFFALNRSSFSGTTLSGGCSDPSARFTQSSIDRLKAFANFEGDITVNCQDWVETLSQHQTEFMYLDPPYMLGAGDKLYGSRGDMHKGFNHVALSKALKARPGKWLLSYNDCEEIRFLYQNYNIEAVGWRNSMAGTNNDGEKKEQCELLVRNY